jgi:SOS-response transcriptional repressor LexA
MPEIKYDRGMVLNYIVEYKRWHDGNAPTIREIMAGCKIASTSNVYYILKEMESQGMIKLGARSAIQVVGGQWTYKQA